MFWNLANTLRASKIPAIMQEPGIIIGYRQINQPWSYYARSMFQIHNETLNIWSHLIAIFVHLSLIYQYAEKCNFYREHQSWTLLIFSVCCIYSTTISVIAHIFHSKNIDAHYSLFLFDYAGVYMYGYASGLIAIYYFSDEYTYGMIVNVYLVAHWIFSFGGFVLLCIMKTNFGHKDQQRTRKGLLCLFFSLHAILLSATVARKYWLLLNGNHQYLASITNYNWIYLSFILVGVSYGCHLPEVFLPGMFDIIGQSHQIFHIFATLTQILQIRAVHFEISEGNASYGHLSLSSLFILSTISLGIITVICVFIIRIYFPVPNTKKEK
ncbi:membrane progestin receptor alpha-like [Mytilus californianus]|uniref:membrane progestin receptor alpha-like n=1 Tax=Mytilus californianus TaxID=6549 RepID=UPI0022464389|nr:membrane progestin receptor alpha-like [Mytilus californianus]